MPEMMIRRMGWAAVAAVLATALTAIYPYQGLLLAVLFGATLSGMLAVGARTVGLRTIVLTAGAASASGPLLSWSVSGVALTRSALELSMCGVMLVAAVAMHRHIAAQPRRPKDARSAGAHYTTDAHG
jgi:hypothetical protein